MTFHFTVRALILPLAALIMTGCQPAYEIEPTRATSETYRDQIDFDGMPEKTRQLYDHLLDGALTGTKASQYQSLLDSAQQIVDRSDVVIYVFQLSGFPKPYKEVEEEFEPVLFVKVHKSDGIIFSADLNLPIY